MRDRTRHLEHIDRWAKFVKENPTKWRKIHTEFINSLFNNHYSFRERILKTPKGKEKLAKAHGIKNKEGYSWLKD